MSPVVFRLTLFVVIEKPPSHYVIHIDEGFYFPTGLFLHHGTNRFPTCNLNVNSWGRVT